MVRCPMVRELARLSIVFACNTCQFSNNWIVKMKKIQWLESGQQKFIDKFWLWLQVRLSRKATSIGHLVEVCKNGVGFFTGW